MIVQITYGMIREKMQGKPYPMTLREGDAKIVKAAVNQGIDPFLEACFCPERGDRYDWGPDDPNSKVQIYGLHCLVSMESMPVLLRRLTELPWDDDDDDDSRPEDLATTILATLGFEVDTGCYEIIAPVDEQGG